MIEKLLCVLLVVASSQAAALTYSEMMVEFQPAAPAAGVPISLVTTALFGTCLSSYVAPNVNVEAKTIVISLESYGTTVVPCPAYRVSPRVANIGPLPRGTYEVVYQTCAGNAPPPEPKCVAFTTETLRVGGGDPVEVPASSAATLALLMLGCLAFARRRMRA